MHTTKRSVFAVVTIMLLGFFTETPAADEIVPVIRTRELGTVSDGFTQPSDVVAGTNKRIYVLDGVNNRVSVFRDSGELLFSFGKEGTGAGSFRSPLGIGIDELNRIYVADSGNHRIQVFSPDGSYQYQLATDAGGRCSRPSDPTDVVVNLKTQRCYVADNDNHCVHIFNLENRMPVKDCGRMGMEENEFRFPFMLDRDRAGNIYVVEVINTRVKMLDTEGAFIRNIGSWGVEPGELYRPKGVAVDAGGRIFVSDGYLGVVQAFAADGAFLGVVGNEQGEVASFKTPAGIFIDGSMRLYVVESLANRLKILEILK